MDAPTPQRPTKRKATYTPTPFGLKLKEIRYREGLTQTSLAEHTSPPLSKRTIGALETGESQRPSVETPRILAEALHLQGKEYKDFLALAQGENVLTSPLDEDALTSTPPPMITDASFTFQFVNRDYELLALNGYITQGTRPLMLVHGPQGVGASRMVRQALEQVDLAGKTVLTGSVPHPIAHQPYEPFTSAIVQHLESTPARRRRRDLRGCELVLRWAPRIEAVVIDTLDTTDASDTDWQGPLSLTDWQGPQSQIVAIGNYLDRVANSKGVVLVLDDLHWAKRDALNLLSALVHRTSATPLRIIGIYDDAALASAEGIDVRETLESFYREGLVNELSVGPLSLDAAKNLLTAVVSDRGAASVVNRGDGFANSLKAAAGLPLALVIYGLALRSNALESIPLEQWSLTQAIERMALDADDVQSDILDALAVFGWPATLTTIATLVERPEDSVQAALDQLWKVELVVNTQKRPALSDRQYAFPHPVVRDAFLAGVTGAWRKTLHERSVTILEPLDSLGTADLRVYHVKGAGQATSTVFQPTIKVVRRMGARFATEQYQYEAHRLQEQEEEWERERERELQRELQREVQRSRERRPNDEHLARLEAIEF